MRGVIPPSTWFRVVVHFAGGNSKEQVVPPLVVPKLPSRVYVRFGEPTSLEGIDKRDKIACQAAYERVKVCARKYGWWCFGLVRTVQGCSSLLPRTLVPPPVKNCSRHGQTRRSRPFTTPLPTLGVTRAQSGERPAYSGPGL